MRITWAQKSKPSLGNITRLHFKNTIPRAGEMALELIELSALPEDLDSIPSTHMAIHKRDDHNHLLTPVLAELMPSAGLHVHQAHMWHKHTCRQNTYPHKICKLK